MMDGSRAEELRSRTRGGAGDVALVLRNAPSRNGLAASFGGAPGSARGTSLPRQRLQPWRARGAPARARAPRLRRRRSAGDAPRGRPGSAPRPVEELPLLAEVEHQDI